MRLVLCLLAVLLPFVARADGEKAGVFDHYVLALSWSSGWCAATGDARDDPQCDRGRGLTFVLHGLWPQHERGWPQYCRTTERDPTRAETAAMADIMGSSGPAFYQWKKHGRCSGLSAEAYFETSRLAYDSVKVPPVFDEISKRLKVPAEVIESAFLEANPQLSRDQVTITCRDGRIQEVRICLTKDLEPRRCGPDTIRDCKMKDAILEAVR
ncbi:ribonuclease T2 [Xinfangfangia sp. CPCC 101601]|uniref:Ribonuclease T2 n=1 Tax=Pseudogemmobacter lacusdianii TaxID=3069608 RepID=A0ABU0VYQ6_9RHOB|nr:ribonuclease T2 [Xinfangfangia sp. CPCC 101601]MDQ2066325.1 ribonuclease T2 [Xinfangfangia sp. CPCC 101601]